MAAVREAIGPHMDLCADMHGKYDTTTGMRVAKELEPYRMMWLEDPIPALSRDAILNSPLHHNAYLFRKDSSPHITLAKP